MYARTHESHIIPTVPIKRACHARRHRRERAGKRALEADGLAPALVVLQPAAHPAEGAVVQRRRVPAVRRREYHAATRPDSTTKYSVVRSRTIFEPGVYVGLGSWCRPTLKMTAAP